MLAAEFVGRGGRGGDNHMPSHLPPDAAASTVASVEGLYVVRTSCLFRAAFFCPNAQWCLASCCRAFKRMGKAVT